MKNRLENQNIFDTKVHILSWEILIFCNISGRNKIEVKATNVLRLCEEAVFYLIFLYGKLMQGGRKGEPGRGPGLPI